MNNKKHPIYTYPTANAHLSGWSQLGDPDIVPPPATELKKIVYHPPQQQPQNPPQKGGKKTYCTYNNRQYLVHKGSRGGNYILVGQDKKRVYV